jgi:tetratricopeptide (TPR) repeat protein
MPACYELHAARARALAGLKRHDEAYAVTTELMTGKATPASGSASGGAGGAAGGAGGGSSSTAGGDISAAAAARGGGDPKLLLLRAQILNQQGNTGSAVKHLQEALRIDPDDTAAGRLLKALRKQESLKASGNDHFKAGAWQVSPPPPPPCLGGREGGGGLHILP